MGKTERLLGEEKERKNTKNYFTISSYSSIFNYDCHKEMKTSPKLFECLFHSLSHLLSLSCRQEVVLLALCSPEWDISSLELRADQVADFLSAKQSGALFLTSSFRRTSTRRKLFFCIKCQWFGISPNQRIENKDLWCRSGSKPSSRLSQSESASDCRLQGRRGERISWDAGASIFPVKERDAGSTLVIGG